MPAHPAAALAPTPPPNVVEGHPTHRDPAIYVVNYVETQGSSQRLEDSPLLSQMTSFCPLFT